MSVYANLINSYASLVGYYRLDETSGVAIHDQTANHYDGTASATGITLGQPGLIQTDTNTAILFTQANSGVITLPTALNPNGWTNFSVACWITPTTLVGTNGIIGNSWPGGSNTGFAIGHVGTTLYIELGTGTTSVAISTTIATGTKYCVVLTYDGVNVNAYVNVSSLGAVGLSGTLGSSSNAILIGKAPTIGYFDGVIDEPAFFHGTLHPSDVSAIFGNAYLVAPSLSSSPNGYPSYKNVIEPNLVTALSAKNLLNYVKLIGPETTMNNDGWLTQASTDLANTLSGYIRHAFPPGATDISSDSREAVTRTLVAGILSSDPGSFVIQGAMGSGFYGPGAQVAGYQYGIEMTDYAVQLARAGMSALIAYILDDDMWGTTWGMQKITGGGASTAPRQIAVPRGLGSTLVGLTYLEEVVQSGVLRPWFFPWSLLCNSILEGSTIYAPAQPSTNNLRVLAAQAPQGAWTFVLVNRAASPRQIHLSVPFAPVSTQTLQQYVYAEATPLFVDGNGFPLPSSSVRAVLARGFTVPMAGNSVLILTQASAAHTTMYNVKRPPLQKRR